MAGSACSTPFVSAPSTPARDPSFDALATAGFYSLPASPAALGAGDDEYGFEMGFQFEFSSQFPSPALEEMSSADELFHNGQIRPMRLVSSFLPRPPPLAGESPASPHRPEPAAPDERGRSARRRRSRSHSPFRLPHCLSPASSSGDPSAASRSSSSSSTASSASSSSSSHHRRWRLLKDLLHRSSSDGNGKHHHHHHHHPPPHPPPLAASKRYQSSPATRGRTRSSTTHARVYEARRAEAEEMRRRTFLPYRQGLLLGCLGLGSRGSSYGAMAAAAKSIA